MTAIPTLARALLAVLLPLAASESIAQVTASFEDITPAQVAPAEMSRAHLAVHPLDSRRLLLVLNSRVLLSGDGGRTWSESANPLSFSEVAERVFVHKGRPGVVFLQVAGFRNSPSPQPGTPVWSGGETYRSADFGQTWMRVSPGVSGDDDVSISPFASDPSAPERLFATRRTPWRCARGCAFLAEAADISMLESIDGGFTWREATTGLPNNAVSGTLGPEGPNPAAPGRLFFSGFNGVFNSLDGGRTWSRFQHGLSFPLDWVKQDAVRAGVLYALGRPALARADLLRSDNGGATWTSLLQIPTSFRPDLAFDPVRSERLWITGHQDGLYLSEDGGAHWTLVGFHPEQLRQDSTVQRVFPSSADTEQVYLVHKGFLLKGSIAPRARIAVEYQYGDFYWLTGDAGEAISQDHRLNEATRTGERFGLWSAATAPQGAVGLCRFQGNPARGQHSRFLTLEGGECDLLSAGDAWMLEGKSEYFAMPPNAAGTCAAGLVAVRRFVNTKGAFTNHRYVASAAALAQMRASNWIEEGTAMCARPLGSDE